MLVLVIPAADRGLWERGTAFGEFLNFATDEQLAPLHRCDIACATMADMHVEFGTVPLGEPLMVLVEGGHAPQLRALDCHLVSDRDVRPRAR